MTQFTEGMIHIQDQFKVPWRIYWLSPLPTSSPRRSCWAAWLMMALPTMLWISLPTEMDTLALGRLVFYFYHAFLIWGKKSLLESHNNWESKPRIEQMRNVNSRTWNMCTNSRFIFLNPVLCSLPYSGGAISSNPR